MIMTFSISDINMGQAWVSFMFLPYEGKEKNLPRYNKLIAHLFGLFESYPDSAGILS